MDNIDEDKKRKPLLTWFTNNQATEKKSVSLTFKCTNNFEKDIIIPLKYVVMNSIHNLVFHAKVLTLTLDNFSFEYYHPDLKNQKITQKVNFENILTLKYDSDKYIFNATLEETFYKNTFPDSVKHYQSLENTIWFCANCNNSEEYKTLFEKIVNNFNLKLNLNKISPESYKSFSEMLFKYKKHLKNNNFDILTFLNIKTDSPKIDNSPKNSKVISKRKSIKRKVSKLCFNDNLLTKKERQSLREEKFIYCPSPNHSIEILLLDLECLRENVYINDNIINLYITIIYYQIMSEQKRQKTYFFNSFFNTKVIGTKSQMKTDTSKIRHERVAKWTKNVDIFEKDYLIIPVCESQHWFLIIVCFPWMVGMVNYGKLLKTDTRAIIPENNSNFAKRDRIEKYMSIKESEHFEPLPCILIFDSLPSQPKTGKVNIIREYLQCEWDAKRLSVDGPLLFDKNTIRGYSPKVPNQLNTTDCGVYLLQYVESFCRCPFKEYTCEFFSNKLINWFEKSEIIQKRKKIKDNILTCIKKSEPKCD